jgi:hypothetical protein
MMAISSVPEATRLAQRKKDQLRVRPMTDRVPRNASMEGNTAANAVLH